jgi:hypothetical protein
VQRQSQIFARKRLDWALEPLHDLTQIIVVAMYRINCTLQPVGEWPRSMAEDLSLAPYVCGPYLTINLAGGSSLPVASRVRKMSDLDSGM